ncbi:MAG: glutathione S-transferase family protein [Paracoccus sp. (in: a-proteobacteria)]|nr:glutathione S-transferase family protein [Paracoccus sp. (in: a-proteobacteria)]
MGYLKNGEWVDEWYDMDETDGAFVRDTSRFRNWVTADGAAGPSGEGGFQAESGRYHLYVSYACPWAHRTLIFRALKDLSDHIGVSVVHPDMLDDGWTFATDFPGATGDGLFGSSFMREIYTRDTHDISGRVTVPVLWDKAQGRIVSNESAEIIRMFNSAFDSVTGNSADYWPKDLRSEIEAVNDRIYDGFNNGVYRAGFATSQDAYDEGARAVFETLDWLEDRLSSLRYLCGDRLTEADWRTFTTALRFDPVYHTHFKCNRAWLREYPALWGWTRELYQMPGVAETCHFDHIVRHYYYSHDTINPNRIIPINPVIDWDAPHGRG